MPSTTVVGAYDKLQTSFPAYGFPDEATIEFKIFFHGSANSLAPVPCGVGPGVDDFDCGVSMVRRNARLQDCFLASRGIIRAAWGSWLVFLRDAIFADHPASANRGDPLGVDSLLFFD